MFLSVVDFDIICTPHQIMYMLLRWPNCGRWNGWGLQPVWQRTGRKREFWWENLKETALLEKLCVERRQILQLNGWI